MAHFHCSSAVVGWKHFSQAINIYIIPVLFFHVSTLYIYWGVENIINFMTNTKL